MSTCWNSQTFYIKVQLVVTVFSSSVKPSALPICSATLAWYRHEETSPGLPQPGPGAGHHPVLAGALPRHGGGGRSHAGGAGGGLDRHEAAAAGLAVGS